MENLIGIEIFQQCLFQPLHFFCKMWAYFSAHVYEDSSLAELASKQPPTSLRPRPTPATTLSSRLPLVPAASVVPSADNEVASTGPIYEDIDRMCSYRGYPPDLQQKSPQQLPSAASGSGGLNEDYYNLSGGSSPRNKSSNRYVLKRPFLQKITQNQIYIFFSDVSFEGTVSRLRTMSPASNHRSPQSVYSARLANRPPTSSVYYYSDTLRKGRVGSDSGISVDTPPPKAYHQPRGGRTGGRPPPIAQTEVVLQDPSRLSSGKKRRNDTQVWCWWSRAMKE